MTFLSFGFLAAGLAAGIPVVLHMINRQRAKQLPFSTLRFLRISVQKTRRRRRIHDVFLLLVRMAVLLLIAIGLAEPTLTNLGSFWGGGESAVAIVLDNSASMGTIDAGRPRLEVALSAALQVLDELEDGDQVALMLPAGPKFEDQDRLDPTQDKIRRMLQQVQVSFEKADLASKIQDARKLLSECRAVNKQIYVLTDGQAVCWEGLASPSENASDDDQAAKEGRDIPVIVVNCQRAPKPNVAVSDLRVKAVIPVAGVPILATAELWNTSSLQQTRHVELYLNGSRHYGSPVLTLAPDSRMTHDFSFHFDRGGTQQGELRLVGEDGCPQDDRRFFTLEVNQGIPVAVVTPSRHEIECLDEAYYVEKALNPGRAGGWAIRTTVLTAEELVNEPLSNFTLVLCVNLPAPSDETAERLRQYVARGGHLLWIGGDNVDPEAYNAMNESVEGTLLPAPLVDVADATESGAGDSWNITSIDTSHRALADLAEPPSLSQSVLVYRHLRMDPERAPQSRVLARLDNGQPILMEQAVQRGSVMMLGTSAHIGWTNLPLRPLFLPLLVRLVFEAAGAEQSRLTTSAGRPLVRSFGEAVRPLTVEVVPPSGVMLRLPTVSVEGQPGQQFIYDETHEVGIYTMRPLETASSATTAFSVNLDSEEVDPKVLSREELEQRLADTPVVFAEDPEDLSGTFEWLKEGRSLWSYFLAAVLIVLVFETLIANRLSPKTEDADRTQVEPGMRRLAKQGRQSA